MCTIYLFLPVQNLDMKGHRNVCWILGVNVCEPLCLLDQFSLVYETPCMFLFPLSADAL